MTDPTYWGIPLLMLAAPATILGLVIWEKHSRGYGKHLAGLLPTPPKGHFYRVRYTAEGSSPRIEMHLIRRRLGIFTVRVARDYIYIATTPDGDNLQQTYRKLTLMATGLTSGLLAEQAARDRAKKLAETALS